MLQHSRELNGSYVKAGYDASAQIGPLSTEAPSLSACLKLKLRQTCMSHMIVT